MAAKLEPAGSGVAGQQPQGRVAQYQLDGVNGRDEAPGTANTAGVTGTIGPYDSGTILGTVPPGLAGIKLISGVVQRAAQILADDTVAGVGATLVPTYSLPTVPISTTAPRPGLPKAPAGSAASDGLSLAPQHE